MRRVLLTLVLIAAAPAPAPASAPAPPLAVVPAPSGDPRTIIADTDPLVRWAETPGDRNALTAALAAATDRSPSAREALADVDIAAAQTTEARAALRPRVDAELAGQQALSRGFSHDPGNLIERSAPVRRADVSITVEQSLFDFGGSHGRLRAARARDAAERARAEASASDAAIAAVEAWSALRQATGEHDLAAASLARDRAILAMTRIRIASGLGAPADAARIEGAIGQADARLVRADGAERQARARFRQAFAAPDPARPARLASTGAVIRTLADTLAAVRDGPEARYAALRTDAARRDLAAAWADLRPALVLDITADKYSVTDPVQDHDVRARLTLRQRLYGGGAGRARVEQAAARAQAAAYAQDRILAEGARDAETAWHDVSAQTEAARALREGYLAQRRARDAYAEQFRVSHGTLLELLRAEDELVEAALAYLRAAAAADLARWTLLARTGLLLAAIGADTPL